MTLPFEIVDVVIVVILIISGLLAYFRGLVREVLSLATWIGAAAAAGYGFAYAQPYVREVIAIKAVADIVTGVALFVVALVILTLLNHVISGRVKDSALGAADSGLGFLFGLLRGALLISVAYIAATWFWTDDELAPYLAEARTMPYVKQSADFLRQIVPKNMQLETKSIAEETKNTAKQAAEAEKLLNKLRNGGSLDRPSSYNQNERRDMQRLIDTNRQR
ncbi:MAG: CvpA family protein [Alphaproteobacteria bacterium]|nr:CvpA family protein [Alphaproteobacteria bacterium]